MSFDLSTYLGRKVATSVDVGGLFVPVNSLARYVQAFSAPALFHNPEFPDLELSRRGTMLKLKYKTGYFALVTAHQAQDFKLEQLCIHEQVRSNISTSNSCTFSSSSEHGEEKLDCRIYDFSEAVKAGNLASIGWLNAYSSWFCNQELEPDLAFAVGFPTENNGIDYDLRHLSTQPYAAFGKPCSCALADRNAIQFDPALNFDPDGFSGSPVYGLTASDGGVQFALLGIVTNASSTVANYLPMRLIQHLVEYSESKQS